MEDYKKKYEDAFERAKVINPGTADYEVAVKIFPELKESEDERIRKGLIKHLKALRDWTPGELSPIKVKEYYDVWIAWLEKQSKQEQLYIRFGEIPTDGKSKIHQGEIEVGTENGVSVYPAFKTDEGDIVLGLNLPITKTTLYSQQHLIEYDDRPCYLVKGDYVGKDTDGQPLINNISIIEKIDGYRVKEKKQNEQKLTDEEILNILRSMVHGTYKVQSQETVDELLSWLESIKHQSHWKPSDEQKLADKIEPKFKVGDWIVMPNNETKQIEKITFGNYYFTDKTLYNIIDTDNNGHLWTIEDAKDGDVICCENGWTCIFKSLNSNSFSSYCFMDCSEWFCELGGECHSLNEKLCGKIHLATKEQRDLLFSKMKEAGYEWDAEKKELKKIKQKPARSDEQRIEGIIATLMGCVTRLSSYGNLVTGDIIASLKDDIEWLKSLKNKVQPQPKQEVTWNEEDERISKAIYESIDYPCLESFGVSEDEVCDWFKSLKENN
jgi:hypothetical protein